MAVHVNSASQWRQIVSGSSIVVTDFYADWCGPCKSIAPTFESLATKFSKPGRIAFAKVDVDSQKEIAQQYSVRAMPTFVILRNGTVIETIQGANPPALTAAVEKAVKLAGPSPGAAFQTPGRTLGGPASAGGRGPVQGRAIAFDINKIIDTLIVFVGLYLVSLFSLDPYLAAQNSQFNKNNPTVPINIQTASAPINGSVGGSSGASTASQSSAARKAANQKKFKTLADLD